MNQFTLERILITEPIHAIRDNMAIVHTANGQHCYNLKYYRLLTFGADNEKRQPRQAAERTKTNPV